jgi:drug/metabolite transporter (DMT)-like permease
MALLLGLLVALSYGTGDFFGGLGAKRAPAITVVLGSFALSAVLLAIVNGGWVLLGTAPTPADADLHLGVAVGLIGPVSLGLLYRGLATGRMSIVAPITAVVAAIVPLAWGLATGERPSALALAGVAVALVAVVLISSAPTHEDHPEDAPVPPLAEVLPPAVLSGLGFGAIFVLLGAASDDAGLWPLMVSRPVSVVAATTVAIAVGRRQGSIRAVLVPPRAALAFVAGAGVLDITANAFYLAATNAGLLSIVAVLSSLYPAATVVLARIFLGERLHRLQIVGLAIAVVGVAAMAAG